MPEIIKVLIVEDSAMMRKLVTDMLSMTTNIRVVGEARDGIEALTMISELRPDVVTMDVEMPRMGGYETLKTIMRVKPMPVVMLSGMTMLGADMTVRCLEAGAVDFVAKPIGPISRSIAAMATELVQKVRLAAQAKVQTVASVRGSGHRPPVPMPKFASPVHTVVIGCSTGGPGALHEILPALPPDLDAAVLVIQHMPPNFTTSLAARLNQCSKLHVREAERGDSLARGVVLVAPGGHHLEIDAQNRIRLHDGPTLHGVRPSIDLTMASLARAEGGNVLAVLLTGMGVDGAQGLRAVHKAGGRTIAQDQASCVVFGMPRAAIAMGVVDQVIALQDMAQSIQEAVRGQAALASK